MTPLRKRMLEELQLRNLSEATATAYVGAVRRFAQYFGKSPEKLGPEQVRQYLLHLLNDKKDNFNTIQVYRGALKFLYVRVLKQSWFEEEIPVPKRRRRLPTVLTPQEITRILDRTSNLKHWMILATFYATALRCDELRHLKVSDIDSQRMILHIRKAKGSVQRNIALSPALLERLRVYYRWRRPKDWLFPSKQHPDRPLNDASVRYLCRKAGQRADSQLLVHCRKKFFLPVDPLGCLFRGKFLSFLEEAFDSGELEFYGQLRELAHPIRFRDLLSSLHNKEWVVYAKPPFGGPDQVLRYLARYTHRVAISNGRPTNLSVRSARSAAFV